jgi:hypothetical protein
MCGWSSLIFNSVKVRGRVMADTPAWATLLAPVIAAVAAWATTKFEVLSLPLIREYAGSWYAYYLDPDSRTLEREMWKFSPLGIVTVTRNNKTTFKGKLSLRGNKAYMNVQSTIARNERLFVMLDVPVNPRTGDDRPSVCIWLGKSADGATTAGHGLLSRKEIVRPTIKDEFLRGKL